MVELKNKHDFKKIGLERIEILFKNAERRFKLNPVLANRYIYLARKIAMKYRIRIPKHLKRKFCKKCYKYLLPGVNCRIRTKKEQQVVIIKCLECNAIMRYPYRKEKSY